LLEVFGSESNGKRNPIGEFPGTKKISLLNSQAQLSQLSAT
jgi:hypothetical protein